MATINPHVARLVRGRSLRATLLRALALALTAFVVFRWFLLPVRTCGESMEPTYPDRSVNLINLHRYRFHAPRRGDVIAISLAGGRAMLLKRVLALPGETVLIVDGLVFVDGSALEEPYVRYRAPWHYPAVKLGAGEYFVVGDNRGMPASDHTFGRVDARRIIGGPVFGPG